MGAGSRSTRFSPSYYGSEILPRAFNVLFVGRLARESGIELLAEAFLLARERDPRLHLVLVGQGPQGTTSRPARRRGELPRLARRRALSRVYASADLLVFVDGTNVFGQPMLDAQASGLSTLAREDCAAAGLIENGRNGFLVAPEPHALGSAIRGLARRAKLQDRLATGGLVAAGERSPERSIAQLVSGYTRALAQAVQSDEVARAA